MSLSATTLPNQFMAGYSAVPLRLYDSQYFESNNYKYLTNITWDSVIATGNTSYNYFGTVYTKLNFNTIHNFKRGDLSLLDNTSNDITENGYYNILVVNDNYSVTINRIFELPLGNNNIKLSKVLPYKMPPDPDGEAKLDLSNTLKDFVTQNISDVTIPFAGPDTKFSYDIVIGNESNYTFTFESNINSGNTLGFYNSSITSTTGIPFQIGDQINVAQDLFGWPYLDNFFSSGRVGFTGATTPPFLIGQQVLVTGQVTFPQYNGYQTISNVSTFLKVIETFEPFAGSTPAEPGIIWGNPRPDYNGVATIVNIFIDPIYGYTILTDKEPFGSTPVIGGTIVYADGRVTSQPILETYTGFSVYNTHITRPNWSVLAFDPFVIQNRSLSLNFISTILEHSPNKKWRIERSAKSWLLAHTNRTDLTGAKYDWYDKSGTYLGWSNITGATDMPDFYVPVGFDQIASSPNRVDFCTFSAVTNTVDYYSVEISSNSLERTNAVFFYINDDCTRYELYQLTWKDSKGSWLSFPFQYLSQDSTEVERKNFYQKEGTWTNAGFNYNSYDRGEKTFFLRSRDKILLNSGWLKEDENELIKDLMTSPFVMLQTPNNELISCIVEEDEITFKENMNDQLINYTLNVRISYNENRF
jgi:hypothetical protein